MSASQLPPAFPRTGNAHVKEQTGMDLRDWFAGQALAGMMARPRWAGEPAHTFNANALDAYKQADAMLARRSAAA